MAFTVTAIRNIFSGGNGANRKVKHHPHGTLINALHPTQTLTQPSHLAHTVQEQIALPQELASLVAELQQVGQEVVTAVAGYTHKLRTVPALPLELAALSEPLTKAKTSLATTLTELEERYQRFVKTQVDPLFGAARAQQIQDLANSEEVIIGPYERLINRNLALSGVITTLALATAPLHPLVSGVICVPLAFYLVRPLFRNAYRSLVQERKLSLWVLGATNLTLLWLGGYYIIGSVIFIFTWLGQKLSHITEDRSHKGLVSIFGQQPRQVWVMSQQGDQRVEIEIPFEQLQVGDILVLSAGQMIPADGRIVEGQASIDQHRLTGEAQPAEKGVGDTVLAATVVLAGHILVQVEKAGQETVAAQIGEMLNKTASYQMAIATKAMQIADASVKPTFMAAGLALLTVGYGGMVAITSTIFGLNLRISGPMALLAYLNVASRHRILVKDGRSLELLTTIDTVVFDKTGTLTLDQPHVTQVHTFGAFTGDDVLAYAAAVEQRQNHPIARAICTAAEQQALTLPPLSDSRYEVGYGIQAQIDGQLIQVGSDRFMTLAAISLAPEVQTRQQQCHEQGHSLVMVAVDQQIVGAIELEPTIRPEAAAVLAELRKRKLTLYIISGDQEAPTRALAEQLGIDYYFANTLPENKAQLVEQLQAEGRAVCFVGDGINDSIALKKANVSVSLSGATSVATDTAQIVLMDATLQQLPLVFKLAQEMDATLRTGTILAIAPGLAIWGGVFFAHLGILGAAALFEASLWVGIANALRPLRTYRQLPDATAEAVPPVAGAAATSA